jgi:hypothetical protein
VASRPQPSARWLAWPASTELGRRRGHRRRRPLGRCGDRVRRLRGSLSRTSGSSLHTIAPRWNQTASLRSISALLGSPEAICAARSRCTTTTRCSRKWSSSTMPARMLLRPRPCIPNDWHIATFCIRPEVDKALLHLDEGRLDETRMTLLGFRASSTTLMKNATIAAKRARCSAACLGCARGRGWCRLG